MMTTMTAVRETIFHPNETEEIKTFWEITKDFICLYVFASVCLFVGWLQLEIEHFRILFII